MTVTVRFYAWLRDAAGMDACRLDLPEEADGHALKAVLARRFDAMVGWLAACRLAVNWEYRPWDARICPGDDVSVIPPVNGG